ncbi:MAG: hypothetical protein ABL921_34790, partial [Pirellula sp.]
STSNGGGIGECRRYLTPDTSVTMKGTPAVGPPYARPVNCYVNCYVELLRYPTEASLHQPHF